MKVGRPPKFKNAQELIERVDKYFEVTPKEEWTITGLALELDTTRETLMDYQNKNIVSMLQENERRFEGMEIDRFAYDLHNSYYNEQYEICNRIFG